MTSINLYEAYAAVYDEDLREELVTVEEDFEFIDELSDIELDQVMEEILSEGMELSECLEVFDEVISEARVDMAARAAARKKYAQASEKSAKEARGRAAAKEKSERRAERVERIKSSAKRAAKKVNTTAAGVASAAAGGAAEAGRAASAAKKKVTGKLAAAKERIKSAVKTGRSAVAGGLRRAAAKIEPKETKSEKKPEKKSAPVGSAENPRVGQPGKERKALPAGRSKSISDKDSRRIAAAKKLAKAARGTGSSGTVQQGQPAGTFASKRSRREAQKREARLSANESFELLDLILDDMISEGYAVDLDEAYDIVESLDIDDTCELVESYLVEEVEDREDLFDCILEYLVDEGYADTNDNALVIMTNMSKEWREDIIEKTNYKPLPKSKMMNKMINRMHGKGEGYSPETRKMLKVKAEHNPEASQEKEKENRAKEN